MSATTVQPFDFEGNGIRTMVAETAKCGGFSRTCVRHSA